MSKVSKTELTKHAKAYQQAYAESLNNAATGDKLGAILREQAGWAIDKLGDVDGVAFLAISTANVQRQYIEQNPRPKGVGALDPIMVKWRNTFANPYRAVRAELDQRKTSHVLRIGWKEGAEDVTGQERKAGKGATAKSPLEKAVAAIEALEGKGQADCAAVVAAVVKHFGISRVNKAVSG